MEKQLGPEAVLSITKGAGKVRLSVAYDGSQADAGAFIEVTPAALVDALAELVPGNSDAEKMVASILKSLLASALA